jgi:hypothetical protein
LGIEDHPPMDGHNFWPLVTGEAESLREHLLIGFGRFAAARTKAWHYFQGLDPDQPGKGPALYDLQTDRAETTNVVEEHPDVVEQMQSLIGEVFPLPE